VSLNFVVFLYADNTYFVQQSDNVLDPSFSVISPNGSQHIWLAKEMVNNTIRIPARWHDCIRDVSQQFDSMKKVRLTLIYYSITKKFVYKFMQNDKIRINVECSKKDTSCTWRVYASRMTHNIRFAIKIHNHDHTNGGDMGTDGHRRASRK